MIHIVALIVQAGKRIAGERVAVCSGAVSLRTALGHERRVGHAHLIEVGVAAENVEGGHLRLPTEAADRWFAVVRIDEVAWLAGSGGIEDSLESCQRDQGAVGDRIHQTEPEERSGATAGDHVGLGRNALRSEHEGQAVRRRVHEKLCCRADGVVLQ